jgi:integrase
VQGRRDLHLRDEALIRLYCNTGARLSEIGNLHVDDVELPACRRPGNLPLSSAVGEVLAPYSKYPLSTAISTARPVRLRPRPF